MMKMRIFLTCASMLLLFSVSCQDDLLDKKPLDKISSADVWKSEGLIEGFIADLYAQIIPMYSWVNDTEDDWSDDMHSDFNRSVAQETIDASFDAGWNQYGKIRACNLAIQEITASELLDEDVKNGLIAESRMLRGMVYFWLARRFGGLMLVDRVLTPEDDLKLPRASEEDVYDFIVEDLLFAKEQLPLNSQKGRLNKAAAHAFLIRVLLQAKRYDVVVEEGKAFIEENGSYGYSIDPDFGSIFNDYDKGITSSEVIFYRYATEVGLTLSDCPMQYRLPLSTGENDKLETINDYEPNLYGWAMHYPTQDLVDAFLMVDNDGEAKHWRETNIWKSRDKDAPFSFRTMYQNRDKRFYQTIIHDGSIYLEDTVNIRPPYWGHRSQMTRNQHRAMTGYLVRKGMYNQVEDWSWPPPPIAYHWPLLRLSEVYLNYAEALLRTGKAAEALPYINATRELHGGLPPLEVTSSILEDYKRERRCELAFEMLRYWDLIRWAETENLTTVPQLNKDPHYIDMDQNATSFAIMTVNGEFKEGDMEFYNNLQSKVYNNGNRFPERRFTPKRFRFPIPLNEMLENNNLEQNQGW